MQCLDAGLLVDRPPRRVMHWMVGRCFPTGHITSPGELRPTACAAPRATYAPPVRDTRAGGRDAALSCGGSCLRGTVIETIPGVIAVTVSVGDRLRWRSTGETGAVLGLEGGGFVHVGNTGAGKSPILEAITYALYAATSWDQRNVRDLVTAPHPYTVSMPRTSAVKWSAG